MRYVLLTKDKCIAIGVDPVNRMTKDNYVVITAKELIFSSAQGNSLQEQIKAVDGRLMTIEEVKKWYNEYK